jgi:hypothetical protein
MRMILGVLAGLMAIPFVGCMKMDDGMTASGRVRVVHASPDAPAVDVCVNGQVAFANAAFRGATSYAQLAVGTYAVRVIPTGAGCSSAGVINAQLEIQDRRDVTVVAVNPLASIEPLVLNDDNSAPQAGQARVRFVHASPNAPTVDITLTDGTTLFNNVPFKGNAGYITVAAGSYDLQVRDETGTVVVLELPGVNLAAGGVYTVFAVGLLNGTPALDALLVRDR